MSPCTVASDGKTARVQTIFFRVFLDMDYSSEYVLNQMMHVIRCSIAIQLVDPSIIDTEDHIAAILDQFPGQSPHNVFVVRRPSPAMDNYNSRKIVRSFG